MQLLPSRSRRLSEGSQQGKLLLEVEQRSVRRCRSSDKTEPLLHRRFLVRSTRRLVQVARQLVRRRSMLATSPRTQRLQVRTDKPRDIRRCNSRVGSNNRATRSNLDTRKHRATCSNLRDNPEANNAVKERASA